MRNSQEVATAIKTLAKEKNIAVGKMLSECGLSKNALSTMQSGGYLPRTESLAKIADYLDCSVDFLIGRVKQKHIPAGIGRDDEKKDRLISNYEKLNAEGQEKLVEYSDDLVATNRYVKSNAGADKVGA